MFLCRLFGHRWRTRRAHDGVHWRCFRCGANHVVTTFRITDKENR